MPVISAVFAMVVLFVRPRAGAYGWVCGYLSRHKALTTLAGLSPILWGEPPPFVRPRPPKVRFRPTPLPGTLGPHRRAPSTLSPGAWHTGEARHDRGYCLVTACCRRAQGYLSL